MKTFKEVYDYVLPESKRSADRKNIILHTVVRPLSIYLTLPLLETKIKPTTVTKISVAASVAGLCCFTFGKGLLWNLLGWLSFFTWAVLDCVDGNIARYKKQTSAMGEVWDAFGGYVAMVLTYLGAGMAAFRDHNAVSFCEPYWLLFLGGVTAVISILPRLMMHKKRQTIGSKENTSELTNKASFGLVQSVVHNFISLIGLFQIVFLLSIILHILNFFLVFYFILNLGMMLITLRSILKE